ncbi:MAG: ferrous iron transporter B [Candidatus Krumholzibacteriota bacterium]|nr:ferrous iron transporter B [Candidatus Krumholzibacteriota bacterium]
MKDTGSNSILLVGNPNVGKSVIFAFLTGRYAIVSNYPGTTVEVSTGWFGHDRSREVIDTPGVDSLIPRSEDERVTRDILLRYPEATVVQVADAKNLFRALVLTTQLAEMGRRVILVLNMMDEARQRGLGIDAKRLSGELGIEVVETVAVEKRGLSRLDRVLEERGEATPRTVVEYTPDVRSAIAACDEAAGEANRHGIFGALTALSGEFDLLEKAGAPPGTLEAVSSLVRERGARRPNPFSYGIASARKETAERLLSRSLRRGAAKSETARWRAFAPAALVTGAAILLYLVFGREALGTVGLHPTLLLLAAVVWGMGAAGADRMNRFTLHPVTGTFFLLFVLWLVYRFVGVFAAGAIVDLLETRLFGDLVIPAVSRVAPTGWIHALLVGDYGLVSMGLNYSISIVLPIVVVFFLVFGLLEDSGYFPRLTVLTNNIFRAVGVNGKATLPMVLGFGCVTMAVLATRILETRRERIIAVTLLALAVPCSAQLGVILALMSTVSAAAVAVIAGIITAEFFLVGALLSRILKGGTTDFILELPPLRTPRAGNILIKTGARVKWFLREALPFFLLATFILFLLDTTGALRILFRAAEPVTGTLLGLPSETAGVFILGFFRRDYGAAGLYKLWESGAIAGNQIVVALVVMSLFLPCLATLIVMIKELGLRWALSILGFVLAVSLLTGGALNLVLSLTGARL